MEDDRIRVLGWPAFSNREQNPYNWLLYVHVREAGTIVEEYSFRRLISGHVDILHIHWPEWQVSRKSFLVSLLRFARFAAVIQVSRARGIRVVWTVHNLGLHERYHPRLEKALWRFLPPSVNGYISLNRSSLPAIRDKFPALRRSACDVIPHGHYRDVYPNILDKMRARDLLEIPRDAAVVGYFGIIRPYKNVPHMLRCFADIRDDRLVMVVAGKPDSGSIRGELEEFAAADPRVRLMLGFLREEEVQRVMNSSDLMVFPFREIWNSGSALLALSFNRPVLVPDSGAFPELKETVGSDWVMTYSGPLTPEVLSDAVFWALSTERSETAPMETLDWREIATRTAYFYRIVKGSAE